MSTDDSSSSVMRPEGSHISKLSASYSISSEKRSQESTWEIEASAKHQSFSTLEQLSPSFKTNTEDDSSLSSKIPEALSLSQSPESRNVSEKLHQDEPEGEKVVVNLCQGRHLNDHPRIPKNDSMNSVESRDPVHPSQSPQENIDLKKYIYPKRLDKRRVREISNIYYSG
ncbi:hypothetical protein NPIL_625331 [Nephila pilipes]|uniref:Uncharacterized protein n=1 Tax=Nephila pilipes TaxID=299642 RepID=A0A8X6P7K6_NEPPI|nr:hypothetical protein NPIL_625331 [Nephila pilipes]